jgi:hypothetical protein
MKIVFEVNTDTSFMGVSLVIPAERTLRIVEVYNKIQAVKLYRGIMDEGLKDALDAIRAISEEHPWILNLEGVDKWLETQEVHVREDIQHFLQKGVRVAGQKVEPIKGREYQVSYAEGDSLATLRLLIGEWRQSPSSANPWRITSTQIQDFIRRTPGGQLAIRNMWEHIEVSLVAPECPV